LKIYKYQDYEDYVNSQTEANVRKIKWISVSKDVIKFICIENINAKTILCHGTRNGTEQKYFKEFLPNAEVIGTEISHTANNFSMTIQHDFQEPKQEWTQKFDIVYSNSFDHAFDPVKCLNTWKDQISENGFLYIDYEFLSRDNKSRKSDPLEISENEIYEICSDIGLVSDVSFPGSRFQNKIFRFKL